MTRRATVAIATAARRPVANSQRVRSLPVQPPHLPSGERWTDRSLSSWLPVSTRSSTSSSSSRRIDRSTATSAPTRAPTASRWRTACRRSACPIPAVVAKRPTTTLLTSTAAGRTVSHNAKVDVDGGKIDGFIASATSGKKGCGANVNTVDNPTMLELGYAGRHGLPHAAEIPNYWTYAKDFTLDDHMFEPVASWSLPDHLYLVSGWSAKCSSPAPLELRQRDQRALHPRADAEVRGPGHRHRYGRRVPTPGPTSRGSSTTSTSRGPITFRLATSPIATTTQPWRAPLWRRATSPRASGTRSPSSRTCRRTTRSATSSPSTTTSPKPRRDVALGHVDYSIPGRQRAPASQRAPGPGLRHCGHQRGDEEPGLGLDGHFLAVGRLGWLLRQRRAAAR